MWVFIDCYDSFSYSLIDLLKRFHEDIIIFHYDDEGLLDKIRLQNPDRIILSPGPGHPHDYGIIFQIIEKNVHVPILGICLGHQILSEYFGYKCLTSGTPLHGKVTSLIPRDPQHLMFQDIPEEELAVMHYHSLIVHVPELTDSIKVLAIDPAKQVMMIEHTSYPIMGIQFHPESILCLCGYQLISNWVSYYS